MKRLLNDQSRCAGRTHYLIAKDEFCEHRETCLRYMSFIKFDRENGIDKYRGIPVAAWLCDESFSNKIELENEK